MEKIYVKLKDTSGSYFIFSQGISVNRNQIVEVEKDETVTAALLNGVLVESTKSENDKFSKERNDYFAKQEKEDKKLATAKKKSDTDEDGEAKITDEFNEDKAKELLKSAIEKSKVKLDKDIYSFGKLNLGTEKEAIELLLNDEKVRGDIQKSVA